MAVTVYANGIGASSGHALTTTRPYCTSGSVWYLGPGGVDAAGTAGIRREAPLATLAQAHTNASAGDTIVCLSGHTQTISSAQTFNKANITLVSEATGSNRARFTCGGTVNMFDVTAVGVQFLNLYFPPSTAAATSRLRSTNFGMHIEDCQFDCGALDDASLRYDSGMGDAAIYGTTFTVTAAGAATGVFVDEDVVGTGLRLEDVTFDGGSFGWAEYAMEVEAGSTLTGLKALRVNLLNNSDVTLGGATGYFVIGVSTGSAFVT